jgi:hypothetical protein
LQTLEEPRANFRRGGPALERTEQRLQFNRACVRQQIRDVQKRADGELSAAEHGRGTSRTPLIAG